MNANLRKELNEAASLAGAGHDEDEAWDKDALSAVGVMKNWPEIWEALVNRSSSFAPANHLRARAMTLTKSAAHTKDHLQRMFLAQSAAFYEHIADELEAQARG